MLGKPQSYICRAAGDTEPVLDCSWGLLVSHCGSCSFIKTSGHQQTCLWKGLYCSLTKKQKVCLLHGSFALHLSFWHMGSRRSLLLTEWKSLTYGLITVNYQQRERFAGGQLNPARGFSERLPRISVLCHISQGRFAPPQRTNCSEKSPSPGVSLGWEPFCKWQHGNCLASQPFWAPWHQSPIYITSITLSVTQWEVPLHATPQDDTRDHVRTMEGCRKCSSFARFTSHLWKCVPPVTVWSE